MKFEPLHLSGAWLITPDTHRDVRGEYQRTHDAAEFEAHGLKSVFVEAGRAVNPHAGTVRGLHFQRSPYAQAKLVRCTQGSIADVIVDLRPHSLTYLEHQILWLRGSCPTMLYVPEGFAHGYQTQVRNTVVEYQMSEVYAPGCAQGVRHDDPSLGIKLPLLVTFILERDKLYPDLVAARA